MPSNDREVFDHLRSGDEAAQQIDFLAYALFAYEKSEWISHFEAKRGQVPNQAEIDAWIGDITTYQFTGMRQKAADLFDAAARTYMRDEIEGLEERALNSAIVAEVRAAGVWWKQLLTALAMSILAPLILGAIIVFGHGVSLYPTPSDVAHRIEPSIPDAASPPTAKPAPSSPNP